jgi:hypothetical protein
MLTLIAAIIGGLATVYATGFSVVARKRWSSNGAGRALIDGLAWPWLVMRSLF